MEQMKHILLHKGENSVVIAIDEIVLVKNAILYGSEVYIKGLEKTELIKETPDEIYKKMEELIKS